MFCVNYIELVFKMLVLFFSDVFFKDRSAMPVDINQACRVDQLPTRNWDHEMFNLLNLLYVKKCDLMHSVCYPPSNFVDVSDPGSVEERCQNDYFQ